MILSQRDSESESCLDGLPVVWTNWTSIIVDDEYTVTPANKTVKNDWKFGKIHRNMHREYWIILLTKSTTKFLKNKTQKTNSQSSLLLITQVLVSFCVLHRMISKSKFSVLFMRESARADSRWHGQLTACLYIQPIATHVCQLFAPKPRPLSQWTACANNQV
jgi:hypothetical protein